MLKYEMIVNDLQKRIMNEEFEETRKLPTEEKLIEEYGVSRNTIRNAIKILMNLGIIYPVQGSGMFVRAPKKKGTVYLNSTRGVTMDNPGNKIINKLLDIQIVEADEKLSEQMNCKVGTPVYYLKRLRIVDGIPYALERTYYNKEIVPYLGKEIAEGSIFNYLKDDLKISFGFADKYLTAIKLSKEDAALLELEENDPAIMINDNIYLSSFSLSSIIVSTSELYSSSEEFASVVGLVLFSKSTSITELASGCASILDSILISVFTSTSGSVPISCWIIFLLSLVLEITLESMLSQFKLLQS